MNKPRLNAVNSPLTTVNSTANPTANPTANAMDSTYPISEHVDYRTVSKAAVVCVVFAVMGLLLAFVHLLFVILPLLSIGFGLFALYTFRRYPDELTGQTITRIAVAASAIVLVSSIARHAWVYATEVPEGYDRISFYELKPDKRSRAAFPQRAQELDGEKVFLKGYVRPGLKKNRLKKFILVGDFGSCCFGGNPEITDVVAVTIKNENDHVDYGYRVRKISGEFILHRRPKSVREKDLPSVLYEIEADYVK